MHPAGAIDDHAGAVAGDDLDATGLVEGHAAAHSDHGDIRDGSRNAGLTTCEEPQAEAEERAANAEKAAQEKFLREQQEKEDKEKAEAEARAKNKAHMGKINTETKTHLLEFGLTDEQAKKIIIALALNEFRHIKIIY